MAMMISTTTKKPLFFLPLLTLLVLLHDAYSIDSLSFSFSKFDNENADDLVLDGDASIVPSSKVIQLTKVDSDGNPLEYSAGRVSYPQTFHLSDASSGREAGFTTSFQFRVTAPASDPTNPGDGLTFFIATPNYPLGGSGGNLGLFGGPTTSDDKVVAIEFDTYANTEGSDPDYRHVGIDVNSNSQVYYKKWDWVNGDGVQVTITYEPYSKLLRVIATNFSGSKVEFVYGIDLAAELSERVKVGFTAATGGITQVTEIINWSFSSELGRRNYVAEEGGHIASVV